MRRQHAFTLIELLVVIAVIALLLSILMPSLQKAKKMAQSTVCQANVKQWGLVFRFYADDNKGKLPQSIAGGGLNSQEAYWPVATLSYYQDTKGANRIPLFMDCVYVDVYPLENNSPLDFEPPPYQWSNSWGDWGSQAMRLVSIDRHGGAINAVFLDGSVGKIPLRGLWKRKWHSNYNLNGPWTRAGGAQLSDWPEWMRNFRE